MERAALMPVTERHSNVAVNLPAAKAVVHTERPSTTCPRLCCILIAHGKATFPMEPGGWQAARQTASRGSNQSLPVTW